MGLIILVQIRIWNLGSMMVGIRCGIVEWLIGEPTARILRREGVSVYNLHSSLSVPPRVLLFLLSSATPWPSQALIHDPSTRVPKIPSKLLNLSSYLGRWSWLHWSFFSHPWIVVITSSDLCCYYFLVTRVSPTCTNREERLPHLQVAREGKFMHARREDLHSKGGRGQRLLIPNNGDESQVPNHRRTK